MKRREVLSVAQLRAARKRLGLTQEEMGERIGYSGALLSRCEAGERRITKRLSIVVRQLETDGTK